MTAVVLDPGRDAVLIGHLLNYRFTAAADLLDADVHGLEVRELVHALARLVGSPGWFDGDLATVINAGLQPLLPQEMR